VFATHWESTVVCNKILLKLGIPGAFVPQLCKVMWSLWNEVFMSWTNQMLLWICHRCQKVGILQGIEVSFAVHKTYWDLRCAWAAIFPRDCLNKSLGHCEMRKKIWRDEYLTYCLAIGAIKAHIEEVLFGFCSFTEEDLAAFVQEQDFVK